MDDCDRHEDEDDCGNEEEGGKTRSRDKIKSRGVKTEEGQSWKK